MDRRGQIQDIYGRALVEIEHLLYHSRRVGTLKLDEEVQIVQHIIKDFLSLIGYGTAAEPEFSGEDIAFRHISNLPKKNDDGNRIIFDIGAHEGGYFKVINNVAKTIGHKFFIHCFEPDPTSFSKLKNHSPSNNVKHFFNNFAISDMDQNSRKLYTHIYGAAQSSLHKLDYEYDGSNFNLETDVSVKNLNTYCKDNKINSIDLLKIDTEGHEYTIINSVMDMIKERKISAIQFEFGVCDVETKVFFKDFWRLLSPYYKFYRVHPEGLITIDRYREEYEVFHVVNYLCILKD